MTEEDANEHARLFFGLRHTFLAPKTQLFIRPEAVARMLQDMNDIEVASSVLGWISIGCWIIVYSPQFIENYQLKSGEGLSVAFVLIWLTGDLANLLGALIANLLPTVIILAVYYSLCDTGLLFQIYYYRYTHPVRAAPAADAEPSESAPLLPQLPKPAREQKLGLLKILRGIAPYVLGTVFVLVVGAIAYWVDTKDRGKGHSDVGRGARKDVLEWRSQVFGWISAVLYLSSRVPQIFKNVRTKCAGLSPVLFFFAIAGNATYVASILMVSTEAKYLVVNASWLAGSGLTIFLDVLVLAQFIYFRTVERVFVPDRDLTRHSPEA